MNTTQPRPLLDCYRSLGLPSDASPNIIKARYRQLALRWHPDRFGDRPDEREHAEEKMKALNAAYRRIKDAPLRASGGVGRSHQPGATYSSPRRTRPTEFWYRPCPNCGVRLKVEDNRYTHCYRCGVGFFPRNEGYRETEATSEESLEWWQVPLVAAFIGARLAAEFLGSEILVLPVYLLVLICSSLLLWVFRKH